MAKRDVTRGEILCTFIKRNVLTDVSWTELEFNLDCCGRGAGWAAFMEEVVATHMTGRLVTAGVSIAESLGGKRSVDQLTYSQRVNGVISETMHASLTKPKRAQLFELVNRAVLATYGRVIEADSTIINAEAGRPPKCFLCHRPLVMVRGDRVQDLSPEEQALAVEDEHIWPRSYGGDTIAENLALACHSCNHNKANFANWAMVEVQSIVLGMPSVEGADAAAFPDVLRKVPGRHRFALASKAAYAIANEESITLKEAYYRIRGKAFPHPKVHRLSDVADFFNLISHTESV